MKSFVALAIVPLLASASAPEAFTIPLTRIQHTGAYLKGSVDVARARAAFLRDSAISGGPITTPATILPSAQNLYTTKIGIGKPPTYYNLLVDTGSSITFCGTGTPYVRTSTSVPTGQDAAASYGGGANFTGLEYLDQVTLAPNLVIKNQSISDALSFQGFPGFDGILGVGPVDLTQGVLFPDVNASVPTVMDTFKAQNPTQKEMLGLYFAPASNDSEAHGALTYGGTGSSLYEGEVMFAPVTDTSPSSGYWGINITLGTFGEHTIIPTSTAGVVDSGTSVILLEEKFFSAYLDAIPGAKVDSATGFIEIPRSSISSMHPLHLTIAGHVLSLDVAAQLIPQDQVKVWGVEAGKYYSLIVNMGNNPDSGFDFMLGQPLLDRYYSVFDTDNQRIGFARTNYTFTHYQE